MAGVMFDNPPVLAGDEGTQLKQLYNYLFTMSGQLNQALMEITIEQSGGGEAQQAAGGSSSEYTPAQQAEYDAIRSMIVKTAKIVRSEMDEISTQLHGEYEALKSDFGNLEESMDATITATALGVMQEYGYNSRIETLESDSGDAKTFILRTDQYIFSGMIDDNPPRYGIAIGEGVTAYDANGEPYLNPERKMATFTMDELAFWQGETKMAYFSSGKFHIAQGVIDNSLQMGNFMWKILSNNAIALVTA